MNDNEIILPDTADRIVLRGTEAPPKIIQLSTGREVGDVAGHALGSVERVWISRDNQRLLIERDNAPLSLWDISHQSLIAYLPTRDAFIVTASFSGDGRRIVTRSYNDHVWSVAVFSATSGEQIKQIGDFSNELHDVYLGQSGVYVALLPNPHTVEIRDVDGATSARQIVLPASVRRWRFTASDRRLVITDQAGILRVLDPSTGDLIAKIEGVDRLEPLGTADESQDYVPVVLANGSAIILDTISGQVVWRTLERKDVKSAALGPDGKTIVIVGTNGIDVYNTSAVERIASIASANDGFNAIDFNRSGDRLFVHMLKGDSALFDVGLERVIARYPNVTHTVMDRDGSLLALSESSSVGICDTRTGSIHDLGGFPAEVLSLHPFPSGDALAVVSRDGGITRINISNGERSLVATLPYLPNWVYPPADNRLLIYEASGLLSLRDTTNSALLTIFPTEWRAKNSLQKWKVRLDPSAKYVAVLTPDQYVRIYSLKDGSILSSFIANNREFADIAFASADSELVVLTTKGDVLFWNIPANKRDGRITLNSEFSQLERLRVSPIGSQMIAVDTRGALHLISMHERKSSTFYSGHPETVSAAALSPDGRWLASISEGGLLRIWEVGVEAVLLEANLDWDNHLFDAAIQFSDDNRLLIASAYGEPTRVLELPADAASLFRTAEALIAKLPLAKEK